MHGSTRLHNNFSSGLTVEIDAALHAIFSEKNADSFSRCVPRTLYNFLAHCQAAFFLHSLLPTQKFWISVSKRKRVGAAILQSTPPDNPQRWSHLFPKVDEYFRSFCVSPFEIFLQDGRLTLAVLSFLASKFRFFVFCSKYFLTMFFKREWRAGSPFCNVSYLYRAKVVFKYSESRYLVLHILSKIFSPIVDQR